MFPDPIVGCAFPGPANALLPVKFGSTANIHNGYVTQIIWSKIVIVENAIGSYSHFVFFFQQVNQENIRKKIDIVFADGVIYRRFGCGAV
jgi:hypothetical protein